MDEAVDHRYERAPDVVFRRVGEECLLVPIRTSPAQGLSIFSLNRLGASLWSQLATPATLEDLVAWTVRTCMVDVERAAADVRAFVDHLMARSLVRVSEPAR